MKKIGNKVVLVIVILVAIFGLNTIAAIQTQNRVRQADLRLQKNISQFRPKSLRFKKAWREGRNI